MNGVHDMGGMHGFGALEREPNEPVFHAEWERRVFALAFCAQAAVGFNTDQFRYAIERIAPADYLASSYYERWLAMLERLVVEHGATTAEELAAGRAAGGRVAEPALSASDIPRAVREARSSRRPEGEIPARFAAGDRVRARNIHPEGHTRLPRYARGHDGVVLHDHGAFAFPDSHAAGRGEAPEHCYAVLFAGRELWGPHGHERDGVVVDCWESYLEAIA